MQQIDHFIGGEWHEPQSGEYLDNVDPATGRVYSRVADGAEADTQKAVEAAKSAFPSWSRTPAAERGRLIYALAEAIERDVDAVAKAETIDNGKPISLARNVDMMRVTSNLRFFAGAAVQMASESHASEGSINYTLRKPRGVVGSISPWNLPLYLLTWKAAPALATGNTVVAKPSELTPMTAHLFTQYVKEVGFPPGVFNVVHGLGPKVGAPLVTHPDVPTITFTGGTVTGRGIAAATAPLFKKVGLELGGKNPNLVFADADMKKAVPESIRAAYANQGQVCLCGSRLLVERKAYDRFVDEFVKQAKERKAGDPLDPKTVHGAMVSKAHYEKVLGYIELAKAEGGTILAGGGPAEPPNERCKDGYFIEPTVITGLGTDCRTNQEEIFGPVVAIIPFDDDDEAVAMANSVRYGLSASVWTENVGRAHRVAEQLESGTVWINCWLVRDLRVPFGGMKESGVGREGGQEALRFFTEPKNVCVSYGA